MRNLLYIAILLIFTTACGLTGQRHDAAGAAVLDESAASLTAGDAAEALSKLNAVDLTQLHDSALMARWALLYSRALVACRLAAPTDTIADIAVDYYGRRGMAAEYGEAVRLKGLLTSGRADDRLATALYLQKEREFFLYRERARSRMLMAAGIIVVIAAAGIIAWMRQRLKLQTTRNDALMAEASQLERRLDAGRLRQGCLEARLHSLLENRFALIDSLCQTYYESQGTKAERKAIVDKVKSEIESVRTDSLPVMEQVVNDCLDNALVRVREHCPDIRSEDWQLLVYVAAGLSTRTICLLLGESPEVVYKRKSRLKNRLRNAPVRLF